MADIKLVMQAETAPVDRAVRLLDNLQAELRDVKRAQDSGLISTKRATSETKRLNDQIARLNNAARGSATDFRKFEKSVYGSGKAMRQKEIAMQQAGYQLQDFIVQVQGGTNPLIAFSQQGSQLAGFFAGPWGAAIGLGIAALGGLGTALLGTSGKVKDLQDETKELISIMGSYDTAFDKSSEGILNLEEAFGKLTESVRQARQAILDLRSAELEAKMNEVFSGFQEKYIPSGATDRRALLADLFGLDMTLKGFKDPEGNLRNTELRMLMSFMTGAQYAENDEQRLDYLSKALNVATELALITDGLSEGEKELVGTIESIYNAFEKSVAKTSETTKNSLKDLSEFDASAFGGMGDRTNEEIQASVELTNEMVKSGLKEIMSVYTKYAALRRNGFKEERNNSQILYDKMQVYYKQAGKLMTDGETQARQEQLETTNQAITNAELAKQDAMYKAQEVEKERQKQADQTHAHMMALQNAYFEDNKKKSAQAGMLQNYQIMMAYQAYGESRAEGAKTTPPKPPKGKTPAESMASIIKGMEEQANLQRQIVGLSDQEADYLQILYNLKEQNKTASGKMTEAQLKQAAERIAAINAETAALEAQEQRLQDISDTVSSNFGDALMSIVTDFEVLNGSIEDFGYNAEQVFKNMAREIIKELYRIFVVKQITGFISAAVGDVGSLFQGRTGFLQFDGGGYTGSGPRSGGLDGKGGFLAMLHPRETVIDHTKGQSAEGVTVVQNINISTGVQQTVRNEIRTLMPQIAEASKAAVADAKRRGGSYGRNFS